jgi:adenylate kinase family enzyme
MKSINFPIFKTKLEGQERKFNLSNPEERLEYFNLKAGKEIQKLKDYLNSGNTFIAYLLGKKNSGKGTYVKLFQEIVGGKHAVHISIGDVVRKIHEEIVDNSNKKKELAEFLKKNYRGYISPEKAMENLLSRDTKTLLPTEFILFLVKKEIDQMKKKALFIDGFPRDLDQISYSLFFRDLINYREDPDIFILIDVPEAVIDERIKYRRICPNCHTPRNLKLFPTQKIDYDENEKKFYLLCENLECQGTRMVSKEGDEAGIEPIRDRLNLDEKLIKQAFSLYGIPKILLRNSVPTQEAKNYVDDYEITPEYVYQWDENEKKVKVIEKSWEILNDNKIPSYSLLAPPVAVSMIKQMVDVLHL